MGIVGLPNTTHVPVLGKHIGVNVLAVLGVLQVRIDDELAKVDLQPCEIRCIKRNLMKYLHRAQQSQHHQREPGLAGAGSGR